MLVCNLTLFFNFLFKIEVLLQNILGVMEKSWLVNTDTNIC